jgi:hypothetical protein
MGVKRIIHVLGTGMIASRSSASYSMLDRHLP